MLDNEKKKKNTGVPHSKFVLRRKRDDNGILQRYKARSVVCGNEEMASDIDTFSPVVDYVVAKLILCPSV